MRHLRWRYCLQPNSFHPVLGKPFLGAIIKFGRTRALVRCHLLSVLERTADLRGAYLRLARLDGADLSDANLGGAEGLTRPQLDGARRNARTRLPDDLKGAENAER
jgi:hypothetical protein